MTKPKEKTREELQAEIEDGKKKIRQFENREKMLRQKLSKEERRTRSHRLIVRGAVFESIVPGFITYFYKGGFIPKRSPHRMSVRSGMLLQVSGFQGRCQPLRYQSSHQLLQMQGTHCRIRMYQLLWP